MQTIPKTDKRKNILIISYGPVPTPQYQKIEGGGMRAWGLATGLRDNGHNVTVSVFQEFAQDRASHDGVGLHNWALNDEFKNYLNSFDTVIVSYNMGDPSVFVAKHLSHHITLVLDCYVPIYIEISARDSDDKAGELRGYMHEVPRFNKVLQRGDFFLCANEPQKHMYMGILGSLGVINPYSYRQHRVLVVPFGVDGGDISKIVSESKNPYEAANKDDFVLLWFGGLYPWFNFAPLVKAVEELSKNKKFKFYLVGGKNPYNNHPDFVKQYETVRAQFEKMGLVGKSVFFVDWIDFDDRLRWYSNADLVVSINSPGEENAYSWRTRVMDYLWGELPMMTNGGDPLSDELISKSAAIQTGLSSNEIVKNVQSHMDNPKLLKELKTHLIDIKQQYFWPTVTRSLSDIVSSDSNLPYVDGLAFMQENDISSSTGERSVSGSGVHKVMSKGRSYASRAKQKGIKRSIRFAGSIAKAQLRSITNRRSADSPARMYFLSHPIDHTGAPLVLIEILKDFAAQYAGNRIHLGVPAIERDLLNKVLSLNIKMHKMAGGIGGRIIQAGLQIAPGDFVMMNTIALHANYKAYVYWMLESGRLNQAHWFIHEDNPMIRFGDQREVRKIKELINADKLQILVPSTQTAFEYNDFFETDKVRAITLRVDVPAIYNKPRKAKDFDSIRFYISGNPLDGRKGQLLFIAALQAFEMKFKKANPTQYRSYELDLVAIGSDYVSEQIKMIGENLMGERLHTYPVIDRDEALKIAAKSNVTVCSSLNETFALYVAEGMLMGHPVLRNDTSGWQEQIQDGINGFKFDSKDMDSLVNAIEKILSRKLSNEQLMKMGQQSQVIADKFSSANYHDQIIGPDERR